MGNGEVTQKKKREKTAAEPLGKVRFVFSQKASPAFEGSTLFAKKTERFPDLQIQNILMNIRKDLVTW